MILILPLQRSIKSSVLQRKRRPQSRRSRNAFKRAGRNGRLRRAEKREHPLKRRKKKSS